MGALVFGATSGLGLAVAEGLAAEGVRTAFAGRRGELASRRAAEHPGSIGLALDIADPESVHQGIAQATAELGATDILVLNSGGPPLGDAAWLTPHEMAVSLGTCGRSANSALAMIT